MHKQAPNWLIFVQGTANSPSPVAVIDGAKVRTGLGDNLMGAMARPLELAARDKLVYSPHAYGPAAHAARKEYAHADFPANMPHVWEAHWGGLAQPGAPAVVLGEWGTSLVGKDALWAEELATYLKAKNVTSTFFWALNPAGAEGSGLIKVLTGRGATGKGLPSVDGAKLDAALSDMRNARAAEFELGAEHSGGMELTLRAWITRLGATARGRGSASRR